MQEIIELIGGTKTLTITNLILAFCIVFHLICEFAHYIFEFWSHRKDGKQVKENGVLLQQVMERIEKIERIQCESDRCEACSHSRDKEERHEKMDT